MFQILVSVAVVIASFAVSCIIVGSREKDTDDTEKSTNTK